MQNNWQNIIGYITHPKILVHMLYIKWLINKAARHHRLADRYITRVKIAMGEAYEPLQSSMIEHDFDDNLFVIAIPNKKGIYLYGVIANDIQDLKSKIFVPSDLTIFVYNISTLRQFVINDDELRREAAHNISIQEKAKWN